MFKTDPNKPVAYVEQESGGYYRLVLTDKPEHSIGGTNKQSLERYARKQGYRLLNHLAKPYSKPRSILSHGF